MHTLIYKNPNFPGAEVCRIEPEPLIQKLHYSPSAVWRVGAIIPSTTSMHIQVEFATWQRARWGLKRTRVWVGSCLISGKLSSLSFSNRVCSTCAAVMWCKMNNCTLCRHIVQHFKLKAPWVSVYVFSEISRSLPFSFATLKLKIGYNSNL